MKRHFYLIGCLSLLFCFLMVSGHEASAQKRKPAKKSSKKKGKAAADGGGGEEGASSEHHAPIKHDGSGINVKFAPGFLWNTAGLEFEFPINNKMSFGVNVFGKLGTTDSKKNNAMQKYEESFMKNGYLAEVALKYYFSGEAPAGFYGYLNAGYGNLLYGDGTIKPYSMIVRPREFKQPNVAVPFAELKPYRGSLGVGYQFIMPTRHLVANLNGGALVGFDDDGTIFSLYLAPSVGIIF